MTTLQRVGSKACSTLYAIPIYAEEEIVWEEELVDCKSTLLTYSYRNFQLRQSNCSRQLFWSE